MADLAQGFFNTLWPWTETHEIWRQVILTVVALIALLIAGSVFLRALGKVIEGLIWFADFFKANGFRLFMRREEKNKVRRRSQFCVVLEADLGSIAKAESWNDQYYTDLEAEVEMEGGYYISSLHRIFGKVSTGLRKEKSLINAISTSSERAIQLIGEPGSGKSVALRHLARQLAVKGKVSRAKKILVPLYINLREIVVPSGATVTADMIRDFILDNIRRGDSDTTAYVRENWNDYRDRGVWFFLFDSFDEIPAVLHAEKGNPASKEYAEAIRKFLDGMGTCRGILASREFKGPESLPWEKFRILRLTPRKQHELVSNAFLSHTQERTVLRHLATNESSLANTPLFLTLLCRYVKEASKAPKNDYELLSLQIDRLARIDPPYLQRIYGLTPNELLKGAERIARLFAEESSLGLAPTIDQVEAVLDKADVPGGDIQRFVAAMVDSKIARADVANAAPGDRRFAFAHRRYQEALFVRHLIAHPGYLSGHEMLTDPRWREYAVTLLETQPAEALTEMFKAASHFLAEATLSQRRRDALEPLSNYCGYFEWTDEPTQILNLLQEGLARRVEAIPKMLSEQVESFLKVRWETGDSFDRVMVMRVASLLPQETLIRYLEETFCDGSDKLQNEGFNQTTSLIGRVPNAVRKAVLERLADEILGAKDASAVLRIEALAARLPHELGAEYVQGRCIKLRRFTRIVGAAASVVCLDKISSAIRKLIRQKEKVRDTATLRTRKALVFGAVFIMYATVASFALLNDKKESILSMSFYSQILEVTNELLAALTDESKGFFLTRLVAFLAIVIYLQFPIIFCFRAAGEPLTTKFFIRFVSYRKPIVEAFQRLIAMLLVVCAFGVAAYFLGEIIYFVGSSVFNTKFFAPKFALGVGGIVVISFCSFIFGDLRSLCWNRRSRLMFNALSTQTPMDPLRVLLSAHNWEYLMSWLSFWDESVVARDDQVRSISSVLEHVRRGGGVPIGMAMFMSTDPGQYGLTDCINKIEQIRERLLTAQLMEKTEK